MRHLFHSVSFFQANGRVSEMIVAFYTVNCRNPVLFVGFFMFGLTLYLNFPKLDRAWERSSWNIGLLFLPGLPWI